MSLITDWPFVSLFCSFNLVATALCWTLHSFTLLSAAQPLARTHRGPHTDFRLHPIAPSSPLPCSSNPSHFSSSKCWSQPPQFSETSGLCLSSSLLHWDEEIIPRQTAGWSWPSSQAFLLSGIPFSPFLLASAWKQWPLRCSPVLSLFTVGGLPWPEVEFLNYWEHTLL